MQIDWSVAAYPPERVNGHMKHISEYGSITFDEYIEKARTLLSRPVTSDYPAIIRSDGSISRYSYADNEVVACMPDGMLITAFKPISKAMYWRIEYDRN